MSAQVDVLDTMHDCAMRLRSKKCDLFAADLDEARDAVAAMIEERDALREEVAALRHQPAPVVDDAMVDRYLTAVHEHLGGLPSEQWDRDREDGGATLRRIARIGLTAALARAQGVQS